MSSIIETIEKEILSWSGVTRQPHRFGGIEYRIGKREIGHVHDNRLADLPIPMQIRDYLVDSGRVSPHHILPQSRCVSKWIKGEDDVTQVIELFRMRYELLNHQRL